MVADRRRFPFLTVVPRPFDTTDCIALDGVGFTQRFEKRAQRGELAANRRAAKGRTLQVAAPS